MGFGDGSVRSCHIVEERNSRAGSGGLSPERGGILGSVIWTLDLSTSMKYILCYMVSEVGLLRSVFTCILGFALGDWATL